MEKKEGLEEKIRAENGDNGHGRKTYSYDEAVKNSVAYFNGDELATSTWINKYSLKDSSKQNGSEDLSNIVLY